MTKLYDIYKRETIIIEDGYHMIKCKELGVEYTIMSHLKSGNQSSAVGRYILDENRHLLFTLVDIDTLEEFECISNRSIFTHLNLPYNDNESKYIYELRANRQKTAKIQGRKFMIKKSNIQNTQQKDIYYKLIKSLRSRLYTATKGLQKTDRTFDLVGCSVRDLIKHLECKFTAGMSWENYGYYGWHIDHIKPCGAFDLSNAQERKTCFHYTNLQPLWAKENFSKSDNI